MDGLILVDKPPGITSHRLVRVIREILDIKKAGHFGTLDPLATGLMVIGIGKATKFFPFISRKNKVYEGQIRLGFSTDTYDSQGKPTSSPKREYPSEKQLLEAMAELEGEVEQLPPPFSAKKYKGTPLYKLARGNRNFKLKPSRVFIHYFKSTDYHPPLLSFVIKCSSGTYIRSVAHHLGQALGCGAHLVHLSRTAVGNWNLAQGFTLERIKEFAQKGQTEKFLIPLEVLLPEFPKIILDEEGSTLAINGNLISSQKILNVLYPDSGISDAFKGKEEVFRLFNPRGRLLALARRIPERNVLHPFLVLDLKE